ncbi:MULTISPECIES: hypothetical protein [unclassified Sphingomonas]|uniref:hypothetical protein n=1 Tax=unclassified Sphingomonas TaxID=196159 RepID=UPI000A95856A|nr:MULTISPECIES: hypothetical protein [unclassified Sphingomonas]
MGVLDLGNWLRARAVGSTDIANKRKDMAPKRAEVVGWVLDTSKAQFLWDDPRRAAETGGSRQHAKSVGNCPAVNDFNSRLWEVATPFDLRLGFARDAGGRPTLIDLDGDQSAVRARLLQQFVAMVAEKEWRHPERPIIQITTPYIFFSDASVWMSQTPPFLSVTAHKWPGVVIGGRLPIHIWPRRMMWAFEWWQTDQELRLVRGEPWFYLWFESNDPSRHIRMTEAEMTQELREHINGAEAVANYVNRTFSLFRIARNRRPKRLLLAKRR